MKSKNNLLFILVILQISIVAKAQEESLESIGIITKEIINSENYLPNYPDYKSSALEADIRLYTEPEVFSGKQIIQKWKFRDKRGNIFTKIIDENGEEKRFDIMKSSLVWTSYKSSCFQYLESKDGYLKVKVNDVFYWLNQNEIEGYNFKPILWFDYLSQLNSEYLTANINLNLRTQPNKQADKIKLLVINRHSEETNYMKMTGKTSENWAEVEVNIYRNYCSSKKELIKTYTGWIKVVDDNGLPNIFSVPSPCC